MKNLTRLAHTLVVFLVFLICSCSEFLDVKPAGNLATPTSLRDVGLILEDFAKFNSGFPNAAEIASDNFYVTSASLNSVSQRERNAYLWQGDDTEQTMYWSNPYLAIFCANTILETLEKEKKEAHTPLFKKYRSQGLYWRAFYHYTLAQLYCKSYEPNTARTDLGLPLKRTADISDIPQRSNLEDTYAYIIAEMKQALIGLPANIEKAYQPSKAAGYGALSRVYLSMGDYDNAGLYADSCLQITNKLMDYNGISLNASIPFQRMNEEVILHVASTSSSLINRNNGKVDADLLRSYENGDLRTIAFFLNNADGSKAFKGHYTGVAGGTMFTGITTAEMILNRAECYARSGKIASALADVNYLLSNRWNDKTFKPIVEQDRDKLLDFVLAERRRELAFRCLRWTDLKRLNRESKYRKTIVREFEGKTITLEPDHDRYLFKIPKESVMYNGIAQNP